LRTLIASPVSPRRSEISSRLSRLSSVCLLSALFSAGGLTIAGCGGSQVGSLAHGLKTSGVVMGGQQPVTGSTIQLYAVGTTGDGSAATPLLTTTVTTSDGSNNASNSNANAGNAFNSLPAGSFTITGDYTCPAGAYVYLTSTGGNPGLTAGTNNAALAMMAALGPCANLSPSTFIVLNEVTTVGSIAALANYMTSYSAIGSGVADASALQTAFGVAAEYINTTLGTTPGTTLPASYYGSSLEIQTLADAVSACINSAGGVAGDGSSCGTLFTDATPTSGTAPVETIGATLNILNNPALNVCAIYGLVPPSPPFQPTLSSCPSTWTLPISSLVVTVSGPSTVTLGQTAQYTAAVGAPGRGATNQGVTWMVNSVSGGNSTVGTIDANGLYTPPSTAPGSSITISAVSVLSGSASGSTTVTVAPVSVAVSGPANVLFSATGQYSAVVTGASQSVTWMVNGVTGGNSTQGTIDANGLYTAPASAPPVPVTISAQSTDATSASGSVGVSISGTAILYATGDTRTVTQPIYPGVCQVLTAQFNTSQRSSPPAAASDDTARIQAAFDSVACKNTGLAVELAPSGANTAFYSEQLTLNGEGLIVDAGVTLYGGATYNTVSGPLVSINGTNSSLMGPGTIDGRGDILSNAKQNRLVQTNSANNFIAYNVTLQESIYPNLYIKNGNGATVWGVTIRTPATRANADGIDLDSLTNATVTNSSIEAGDDGVAVKDNNAATSNVTVTNNRLYGTHGLSIGSVLGYTVSNVLFLNNYVYGSDLLGNLSPSSNALVVKQKPACASTVSQVTYQNTCIKGVKHLITFYTNYSTSSSCTSAGNPVFNNILVNGVVASQSISGAYEEFIGYSAAAPSNAALAYVSLDANALNTGSNASQYTSILLDNSSLTSAILTGSGTTGMSTDTFSTPGSVPACSF
jgi:polygalacturonase